MKVDLDMWLDLAIPAGAGLWLGVTLLVTRNGVLFYKVLNGLPDTDGSTKQISTASWGGITLFAAIWPVRVLKVLFVFFWTFVPSMILRFLYMTLVRPVIGEAKPSESIKQLHDILKTQAKEAEKTHEDS